MKRLLQGLVVSVAATLATAGAVAADGHARVVTPLDMDAGEVAEGVAVQWDGEVYSGLSAQGRMLRLTGGTAAPEEVAVLEGLAEGDFGFTGHGFNSDGLLYSGVVSTNPELNGLVAIRPDTGRWHHVMGTDVMAMANALVSDDWGGLWVTDSYIGAVWRVWPGSTVEQWIVHPLLAGTGDLSLGFPVGANGIDFDISSGTVYVANTEQSTIVGIPVKDSGAAGEPFVHLELPGIYPDGIAFGEAGNLYVADPPAHTLWKVTPDGEITAVADVDDGLSGPSSVALWESPDGLKAYVSNQAIGPAETVKHGPSIVEVSLE